METENYNEMTLANLKEIAKEKGIKNISKLKKSELIEELVKITPNKIEKNGVILTEKIAPKNRNIEASIHIDENVNNNRVDNLEWCTVGYNINYGKRNEKVSNALKGRKRSEEYKKNLSKSISKSRGKKIICITTGEIFNTIKLAEIKYNIDHSSIIRCCKGKNKSAGKHPVTREPMVWRYIEE